jgi:Tfp pilus assembly protein FimT
LNRFGGKRLSGGGNDVSFSIDRCRVRKDLGFSMVELIVVIGIMMIIAAMALISISGALPAIRANAGLAQTVGAIREAREAAIAQRRNIQLSFPSANQIQLTRIDILGTAISGTTVINSITLENNMQFIQFAGVPDTPDAFGNTAAIDFGGTPTIMFMSDGTFVDASGAPLNGTVRLGRVNEPNTARAVTILGATGRIRGYKWNGTTWVE